MTLFDETEARGFIHRFIELSPTGPTAADCLMNLDQTHPEFYAALIKYMESVIDNVPIGAPACQILQVDALSEMYGNMYQFEVESRREDISEQVRIHKAHTRSYDDVIVATIDMYKGRYRATMAVMYEEDHSEDSEEEE